MLRKRETFGRSQGAGSGDPRPTEVDYILDEFDPLVHSHVFPDGREGCPTSTNGRLCACSVGASVWSVLASVRFKCRGRLTVWTASTVNAVKCFPDPDPHQIQE
jgi:hypothetical protein